MFCLRRKIKNSSVKLSTLIAACMHEHHGALALACRSIDMLDLSLCTAALSCMVWFHLAGDAIAKNFANPHASLAPFLPSQRKDKKSMEQAVKNAFQASILNLLLIFVVFFLRVFDVPYNRDRLGFTHVRAFCEYVHMCRVRARADFNNSMRAKLTFSKCWKNVFFKPLIARINRKT